MKMKKMVGALALTAALAMGTAPAFAADDGGFSDTGSTDVKATVDTVNPSVRATVPLTLPVVFGATGAQDLTCPTADAYYIQNIGDGDIAVADVVIDKMHSTFTNAPIYQDGNDWLNADGDAVKGDGNNYIMFTYKTASNETYLTADHPLSQAKSTAVDKQFVSTAKRYTSEVIEAKGGDDKLNITIGGKCFFNDTLTSGEMSDTLCQIKVTIEAA